jgi:hypothetical protein
MKPSPKTTPLPADVAVEHPAYSVAVIEASAHFLSVVPYGIDGQSLLSTLSYGTAEDIRTEGIRLWDSVPDARDAARRIDMLARHMLAMVPATPPADEAEDDVPPSCPLSEAIKEAGLTGIEQETIDAISTIVGIKPDSKVRIVRDGEPSPDDIYDVLRRLIID